MKVYATGLLLAVLFGGYGDAHAKWLYRQTQVVPIDRVLSNLHDRLANDPNDVATLYQLARIHSMAYSTNLATVDVVTNASGQMAEPVFGFPGSDIGVPRNVARFVDGRTEVAAKKHLTNAIGYYRKAATLVLQGTNATANSWLISPINLGLAWCLEQDGKRDEAIKAYRKALVLAWDMEIEHKPTIKEQLEWSWDKIRAKESPLSQPTQRNFIGPGVCFSEEIIGYLVKILDPIKDAKEIAQLKADQSTIQKMGRAVTPILVPLEADASLDELINPAASVSFDLDGSGLQRRWGWITPKAAWLVFDHDGSGHITSGLEMFGSVTFWIFWRDGYDALSSLDDNGDGKLTGDELRGISLWQDKNGNGIADAGEVRPVADFGIVAIECGREMHPSGVLYSPRGIHFSDGTARSSYDWIAPSAFSEFRTAEESDSQNR